LVPDEIEYVPYDKGGIYSFNPRFPSDYELGLLDKSFDINRVTINIKNKIEEIDQLINENRYSGVLNDQMDVRHLRTVLNVKVETSFQNIVSELLNDVIQPQDKKIEIIEVTKVIRGAIAMSPPIYIGMTRKQSLRRRLEQHLGDTTQFSERLKKTKFSWHDLYYNYEIVNHFFLERTPKIEKLIQYLFKPSLSRR